MGLHFVVLAKLNLFPATAHGGLSPMVAGLIWPFVLKLLFSLRPFRQASTDALLASRFFFFQLGQIVFNSETAAGGGGLRNGTRGERALRLVYERLALVRLSPAASDSDEDSLRTLSMLAL